MEDPVYVGSANVSTTPAEMPSVGFDIFSIFYNLMGNNEGVSGFFSGGLVGFLNSLWTIFTVLSYIICIILLALYIFAAIRRNLYLGLMIQWHRDEEKLYDELYRDKRENNRLHDVLQHAQSDNPNDWKLAIIEADIILDDALKKKGFVGASLGERLRDIQPAQLESLDDAWEAHKIRNRIAHDGVDFVLTKRLAQDTVVRYQRVFAELGII